MGRCGLNRCWVVCSFSSPAAWPALIQRTSTYIFTCTYFHNKDIHIHVNIYTDILCAYVLTLTCMRACMFIRTQMVPEQPRHSSAKLQPSEKLPARRQGPSTNPKVFLLGFQVHWVLYTENPKSPPFSRAQVRFKSGGGKIQLSSFTFVLITVVELFILKTAFSCFLFLRQIFLTTTGTPYTPSPL